MLSSVSSSAFSMGALDSSTGGGFTRVGRLADMVYLSSRQYYVISHLSSSDVLGLWRIAKMALCSTRNAHYTSTFRGQLYRTKSKCDQVTRAKSMRRMFGLSYESHSRISLLIPLSTSRQLLVSDNNISMHHVRYQQCQTPKAATSSRSKDPLIRTGRALELYRGSGVLGGPCHDPIQAPRRLEFFIEFTSWRHLWLDRKYSVIVNILSCDGADLLMIRLLFSMLYVIIL